jgi:hypothetical protein
MVTIAKVIVYSTRDNGMIARRATAPRIGHGTDGIVVARRTIRGGRMDSRCKWRSGTVGIYWYTITAVGVVVVVRRHGMAWVEDEICTFDLHRHPSKNGGNNLLLEKFLEITRMGSTMQSE